MYTVQQVAQISHVSVRTLHHYDKLGLLPPRKRSEGGYRLYGEAELIRLKRILFLRELDFPLREIRMLLEGPMDEWALKRQRALLEAKKCRLERLIERMDRLLKGEDPMNFEHFDDDPQRQARRAYAQEAQERYGGMTEYAVSQARTQAYHAEDWAAIQREAQLIWKGFAACADPEGLEAAAYVEAWQNHVSRWYYPCSLEILAGLGQLYGSDERFARHIDREAPGAAKTMSQAIAAYCAARSPGA